MGEVSGEVLVYLVLDYFAFEKLFWCVTGFQEVADERIVLEAVWETLNVGVGIAEGNHVFCVIPTPLLGCVVSCWKRSDQFC